MLVWGDALLNVATITGSHEDLVGHNVTLRATFRDGSTAEEAYAIETPPPPGDGADHTH